MEDAVPTKDFRLEEVLKDFPDQSGELPRILAKFTDHWGLNLGN